MSRYGYQANTYRNNTKLLIEILDKTSLNIDKINEILNENNNDMLLKNIFVISNSIKERINALKSSSKNNASALSNEAARLDRLEEERIKKQNEEFVE